MSDADRHSELDLETVRAILDVTFVTGDLAEALDEMELESVSPREVRAFLDDSARARSYFNRLARAERELPRGVDDVSPEALDEPGDFERAVGDALFESTLEALTDEGEIAAEEPPDGAEKSADVVSLFGGGRTTAAVLAAAAVAALVVGTIVQRTGAESSDERDSRFRARSAATPSESDEPVPRLRTFCVRRDGGDVEFAAPSDSRGTALECPADGELKLAYENPSRAYSHAAFFGVDPDGDIYWYGPSPAAPEPVEIDRNTPRPAPVGETIRLEVNHEPGRVRIFGLFSRRPLGYDRLSSMLEARRTGELYDGGELGADDPSLRVDRTTMRIVQEANR